MGLKAQNRKHWSNGVEAITNAYIQNWRIRENKKPRYNPQPEQATGGEREQHDVRGGGGGRSRGRGGREAITRGRRGRGRPPLQPQPMQGQRAITAYFGQPQI